MSKQTVKGAQVIRTNCSIEPGVVYISINNINIMLTNDGPSSYHTDL